MPNFLEIALACTKRGLKVTPLEGKVPFLKAWNQSATTDEGEIKVWAVKYPNANVGAVTDAEHWMLDVDDVDWFLENCPSNPPKTLTVRTGSGKLHLYFKHDQLSKGLSGKAVMNPNWKSAADTPNLPQKYMEYPDQVVGPGSIHPDTGKEYKVIQDVAIVPATKEWIDWIKGLDHARSTARILKTNPLRKGWDPETELRNAGLKFDISERDGKIYFNYHAKHGMCLIKGSSHATPGETANPRQSAFVYNPSNGEFWHQCFSGGCQVPRKTAVALEAIGLKFEDVVAPAWRELFETTHDFESAKDLNWTVEGIAQEESMNMIAGPSGQGKTWLILTMVKALLEGSKWLGLFQAKQPENGVLYLVPEVGRRSFYHRIKALRMEKYIQDETLLVRTMSMGPVIPLQDRRILQAAKGRDVILDTAVRFLEGSENDSSDNNLAESGFAILNAGARSWWGVHHSPKTFAKANSMSLEDVLRGTGDFGAMLSTCYGVRNLDVDRTLLHVECVKARDLDEVPRPFQVEGRPFIDDEGNFRIVKKPNECGFLDDELAAMGGGKGGRPTDEAKLAGILADKASGMTIAEIAKKYKMTASGVCKALKRAGKNASDQEEF